MFRFCYSFEIFERDRVNLEHYSCFFHAQTVRNVLTESKYCFAGALTCSLSDSSTFNYCALKFRGGP